MQYAINTADRNIRLKMKYSDEITGYLRNETTKGVIRIIASVHRETITKIPEIISDMAKDMGYRPYDVKYLMRKPLERYGQLGGNMVDDERGARLEAVKRLYSDIWDDGKNLPKLDRWARIKYGQNRGVSSAETWKKLDESEKKKIICRGPPTGADLVILGSTARLAESRRTMLLTFDHDFIIFEREIRMRFGIEVVNGYSLVNRYKASGMSDVP